MTRGSTALRWLAVAGALLFAGATSAQTGTVAGTVTDASTNEPLSGVQVSIANTGLGTLTGEDGRFIIRQVPTGRQVVRVDMIGYERYTRAISVTADEVFTANIALESEAIALDEIIVTGVVGATQRAKVPFSVDQISVEDLPVPSVDAISALQGKVAGATIYSGTGRPGSAPSVLLRGATSINSAGRDQEPLYIVDGVILSSSLADIDGSDIASVEVVKGAAAASLYGSRAANGVVQITTKRGNTVADDEVRYTVRSEIGLNQLADAQVTTLSHPYEMNSAGTAFIDADTGNECVSYLIGPGGTGTCTVSLAGQTAAAGDPVNTWNTYVNQAWPGKTYNQVDRFFEGGNHIENYVSASGRSGRTNFHVSVSQLDQGGVMYGLDGFQRVNFRVNLDQNVRENLQIGASAFYSQSEQDRFTENSGTPLFRLTRQPAGVDLTACESDPTQSCLDNPEDLLLVTNPLFAGESANPLYELLVEEFKQGRARFLGSLNAMWSPVDWLSITGNASYDRLDRKDYQQFPKGYRTVGSSGTLNNGYMWEYNADTEAINASVTASADFTLADGIENRTQVRYLYEQDDFSSSDLQGYNFAVADLFSFDNVDPSTFDGGGYNQSVRADGYFFITNFDVFDRYVIDALLRNDGSSLFGEDQRRHWYYRVAGAWRLGNEAWMNLPGVNELKLRAAYGTAGNRPRFVAQYETYSVSGGVITPVNLGNVNLKPEYSAETEMGVDASFMDNRISLGLTYANTVTSDQILQVPLAAFTGFTSQYRNAGTLESTSYEASLDASIIRTREMSLSARLLFDHTTSEITQLDPAPFTYGVGGQALGGIYYAREGEELGTFYGTQVPSKCAHLPEGTDCDLFQVNDDGILVYTGGNGFDNPQWGSTYVLPNGTTVYWGTPFGGECTDRVTGERTTYCPVGSSVPDYHVSLSSTFTWGGLQLYALLDSEQGHNVYNQTAQWATFRSNSAVCDQGGLTTDEAKPLGYCQRWYVGSGRLSPTTLFVEDGSYVKLREISARYTFDAAQLGAIPGLNNFSGITLRASGRNLITWTDYTGYDPEIGKAGGDTGSAALARVDGYTYPNFRTFTFGIELNF